MGYHNHRIAAGGIIIHGRKILLVRYQEGESTYLVAPGGGVEDGESLACAAQREVKEETGVSCKTKWPVMIDNLKTSRYQMVKIWYLCDYISGNPSQTPDAKKEGIIEVGWYTDEDLYNETVFPEIIQSMKIDALSKLQKGIIDSGIRTAHW